MRRPIVLTAIVLGFAIVFAACGGDDDGGPEDGHLRVVSTVSPITSIVENIGGTQIDLEGILLSRFQGGGGEQVPVLAGKNGLGGGLVLLGEAVHRREILLLTEEIPQEIGLGEGDRGAGG